MQEEIRERNGNALDRKESAASARGVYTISVAAELSGIPIQSLRLYEQRGLLRPERTAGGTRRYSDADLQRLRRIVELMSDGVNIAGIGEILDLQDRNTGLETANRQLMSTNAKLEADSADRAAQHRGRRGKRT
jgi:MerR family transcriptional regulator, heat shock protein HspR